MRLVAEQQSGVGDGESVRDEPGPVDLLKAGRPTSEADPLWDIVGMIGKELDVPEDLAANHDRYLAEFHEQRNES
ncbi:MAG TPA: hypothetical protein VIL01_06700 [Thermomicrobiales bacterium]